MSCSDKPSKPLKGCSESIEKSKCKVYAQMCDEESGGFVTGISVEGYFTEQEFFDKKFLDLTKGIDIIEGCYWSWTFEK